MAEDNPEGMAAAGVSPLSPCHGGTDPPWGWGRGAWLHCEARLRFHGDQTRPQHYYKARLRFHGNQTRPQHYYESRLRFYGDWPWISGGASMETGPGNSHLSVASWLGLSLSFHGNCDRPGPGPVSVLCAARQAVFPWQ